LDGIWSSGWNEFWEGLLVVTDVSTSWAEVIFRVFFAKTFWVTSFVKFGFLYALSARSPLANGASARKSVVLCRTPRGSRGVGNSSSPVQLEGIATFRSEYEYKFSVLSTRCRFKGRNVSKCACSELETRARGRPRTPIWRSLVYM